jgi:hypothetical protein
MLRLDTFSIDDLIECRNRFREIGEAGASLEEVAQEIASFLQQDLVDAAGAPACPLVRMYKTHRLDGLPEPLQRFVRRDGRGAGLGGATRCLTLLGTAGVEDEWNDRSQSHGHQAIPLATTEAVERSPMIVGLVEQLGLDLDAIVDPDLADAMALHHRDYDVYFVPNALHSPLVPAQDGFVVPYGIRSVVGCGGVLPSGDLFALILFTRLVLEPETADLFRTLALSVKATVVPFTFKAFAPE